MVETLSTTLAAWTYVLEVRGNVTGTSGGSYSGTLNVAPVPLPAALPLLFSGLGLLGGGLARRRASGKYPRRTRTSDASHRHCKLAALKA
jgi:hypothetical protein